jgi:predicted transposase/invertase (TIGR01784 family)
MTFLDSRMDKERSWLSQLDTAYEAGEEKGKLKGKLEGKQEKAMEIAVQLLDALDVATIAKKTDLTIDQVEQLKKNGELK